MENKLKIIISGGGTGGHVFPAISIADAIKEKYPNAEILFIGADNRLEMQKVPKAGYNIIGLPIRGLQRKFSFKIFDTFFRLFKSIRRARKIIKKFKPQLVVGVGGYASAALMYAASKKNIPTIIQEQNSYPGITNKLLAKRAEAICVAYEQTKKYFPQEKIIFTGNPVRKLNKTKASKNEALNFFGLKENKKTLFVTGGSLGAKSINQSIKNSYDKFLENNVQLIWQCGKRYINEIKDFLKMKKTDGIIATDFIDRMDLAYKAADLVVSRAGAISISELALLEKAVIFVPSPNVAEDHQTKNAQALVDINAALMIDDIEASEKLIDLALKTIKEDDKILKLSKNIKKYAKPFATTNILKVIEKYLKKV